MAAQKIMIDTDPGDDIDDLLAIAFALLRPELDVQAITTVTVSPEKRARLVRALLQTVGKSHIPVGTGMSLPMRAVSEHELARMTDNSGYVLNHASAADAWLDLEGSAAVSEDAVQLIIRKAEEHAGQIGLVTIGPLTNVAAALRRSPALASQLQFIAMMGGEVNVYRSEHNITWDDHAAEVVFQSGVPLFMGTWDITRRAVVTEEQCALIRGHPIVLIYGGLTRLISRVR
jgi:purine nucleosidase